ncbi:hypothetical protein [Larkinella humicola]|uniref:Uncharacterized protein n=1 Tax=Larkinella humicola TaxID=2607654 RepID=A0A5N1J6I7_9BACT|nr:hypothetical protein [Larkinella humicola]KAA9346320.1 hypothetical protein F0P93_29065 [Larkinella humicola]
MVLMLNLAEIISTAFISLVGILLFSFVIISVELRRVYNKYEKAKTNNELHIIHAPIYNFFINIIAFWKKGTPKTIRKILNDLDNVKNDNISHPRVMFALYSIVDLIFFLTTARIIFYFDHHLLHKYDKDPFYTLVEHIDAAGILNGILGVGIACIIALIIYKDDLTEREKLKNVTTDLQDKVQYLLTNYTALRLVNTFDGRLESFEHILKIQQDNIKTNEFYMMNYSADFGYLRCNNLDILLSSIKEEKDFASEMFGAHENYKKEIIDLRQKLIELCRKNPNSTNISFLDTSSENSQEGKSRYHRYLSRVFDYATIIPWKRIKNIQTRKELDTLLINDQVTNRMVTYIYFELSSEMQNISKKIVKERFIKFLIQKNNENIEEFNRIPGFSVDRIDRIPFQFIVSKPKIGPGSVKNQSCLITFSNIDAIGENSGVYAFQSSDSDVINNLAAIYNTYKNQQLTRNNSEEFTNWITFIKLFDLNEDSEVYTVLKFKPIDEKEIELHHGVALSDLLAFSEIEKLFLNFHDKLAIEQMPLLKYHSRKDESGRITSNDFGLFSFRRAIYFAIGLFGSAKSESTLAEYICNNFSNGIINLQRKPLEGNEAEKNTLIIKNLGTFESIWKFNKPEDIGMIAKLQVHINGGNSTFFILGGLNHYGTEKIANYLRDNWLSIAKETEGKPFVKTYKITGNLIEKNGFTFL